MAYAFYYSDDKNIYLQVGLDSKEEAKEGLENIATIFCEKKKVASGRVDEIKNKKVRTLETYNIKYEKENLKLRKNNYINTNANGTF